MWDVDVSLRAALKDADAEKIMMVQNQLKTIEISFGDVENGLGCLFRRLIQNRVSLLNILSPLMLINHSAPQTPHWHPHFKG